MRSERAPQPQAVAPVSRAQERDFHVFPDGEARIQQRDLKGAGEAERRAAARRRAGHLAAKQDHPPAGRRLEPADHVEEGRLSGAIQADDPHALAGADGEVDVGQDAQIAEGLADAPQDEGGVSPSIGAQVPAGPERGGRRSPARRGGGAEQRRHRAARGGAALAGRFLLHGPLRRAGPRQQAGGSGHDPVREVDRREHVDDAEDDRPVVHPQGAELVLQRGHDHGADDRPGHRARAAEDHHQHRRE